MPRKRPVKRQTFWKKVHGRWKLWASIAAGVVATCAVVIQVPQAFNVLEPKLPATAGYVRDHVAVKLSPFEVFQISSTIATERLTLTVTRENLRRARDELSRNPNSEFLKEHAQQLEADILGLTRRISEAEAIMKRRVEGGSK